MRHSLRDREAAIALDELADRLGKMPIQDVTDYLVERGFIDVGDDAIEAWKRDQARKVIQRSRRYRSRNDEVQLELVNLVETKEDGSKSQYFKRVNDLDVGESAYVLRYWHDREMYHAKQKRRYARVLFSKHGKKLERAVGIDMFELI